jgi:hypothetical protein
MRIPENPYGIGFELIFHENRINISEKNSMETNYTNRKKS